MTMRLLATWRLRCGCGLDAGKRLPDGAHFKDKDMCFTLGQHRVPFREDGFGRPTLFSGSSDPQCRVAGTRVWPEGGTGDEA